MPVQLDNQGRKDDAGKDPWHLLPYDAIRGILKVLAFGANKYAARNWERGMDWSRPYAACMRHLTSWHDGERADPETGYSHLWHAGCCILFLIAFEIRKIGRDDRPKSEPVKINKDGDPVWPLDIQGAQRVLQTPMGQLAFPFEGRPKPAIR